MLIQGFSISRNIYTISNLRFFLDKTNIIKSKYHYGSIFDFISILLFIGFFYCIRSLFKNICDKDFKNKHNLLYTKLIGFILILTQINEYIWYYFKVNYFISNVNISGVKFKYLLTVNPMILITGFILLILPFIYEKALKKID